MPVARCSGTDLVMRLPADGGHGPVRLEGAGVVDPVAGEFASHRLRPGLCWGGVVGAVPNEFAQ